MSRWTRNIDYGDQGGQDVPANEPTQPMATTPPLRGVEEANPFFAKSVSFSEAEMKQYEAPRVWIYDSRIPLSDGDEEGYVGILAAPGGTGKSAFTTGLALHRAFGMDFLGVKTRPGKTFFINFEESKRDVRFHLRAWAEALGDKYDYAKAQECIKSLFLRGKDTPDLVCRFPGGGYGANHKVIEQLTEVIRRHGADLILVETINRATPKEDEDALKALVNASEELAVECNATVLLVGHVSKVAARDGIDDAYAPRGASNQVDNARFALSLSKVPLETGSKQKKADRMFRRRQLGVAHLPDDVCKNLLILSAPKVNGSHEDMRGAVLMERIKTRYALAVRPYEIPSLESPELVTRKAQWGAEEDRVVSAVKLASKNEPNGKVYRSMLDDKYLAVTELGRNEMRAALERCIDNGKLAYVDPNAKRKSIIVPNEAPNA